MRSAVQLGFASCVAIAVFPCAIDTTPLFIPRLHAESFKASFLKGQLGIIPATLVHREKLIAWRYLSGLGLDADAQAALTAPVTDAAYTAMQEWTNARETGNPFGYVGTAKSSGDSFFINCLPDAFSTAARTLRDRRRTYNNAGLVDAWIHAQDQVFANCGNSTPVYPEDPAPGMPPLARADRLYQIAAAHFYAEDFDGAQQRFAAIAADANSPWRETARYLLARVAIRKASLKQDATSLRSARSQLQLLSNGPFGASARDLLEYIEALDDPSTVLQSVAPKLALRTPGKTFLAALNEAEYVLDADRFKQALTKPLLPEPFEWIRAIESHKPDEAISKWQTTRSELWLVAALINAQPTTTGATDLIEAALRVDPASPAYDTASYNAIRLKIGRGEFSDSRTRLETLLNSNRRPLASVDNALREQRMSLATSFDDFLHWAPRRPIGIREDDAYADAVDEPPILDFDSAGVLNYVTPLDKLIEAAENKQFPAWPRTEVADVAWIRAVMLGDNIAADRLVPLLQTFHSGLAQELTTFANASGQEKRFIAALLIERHSNLPLDVEVTFAPPNRAGGIQQDWWCVQGQPKTEGNAPFHTPIDNVLSQADRDTAAEQLAKLIDARATQNFLAPIVMNWAASHPSDPRVPEALHRLVRVTRYGCRQAQDNGRISKAAFDLLHKRYGNSDWAKQTPYWFN